MTRPLLRGERSALPGLVTISLALIFLTVGCSAASHTVSTSHAVPWLNRPVASTTAPTAGLASPSYPACTSMSGQVAHTGTALGSVGTFIRLTNSATSPCSLSGYPASVSGEASSGQTTPVAFTGQSMLQSSLTEGANLQPGQSAEVGISFSDACTGYRPAQTYPAIVVGLPSGSSVTVSSTLNATCGVAVTMFGLPASTTPTPMPSAGPSILSATVNTPRSVARGSSLHYTVTLQNPTSVPVPLTPCPVYSEGIKGVLTQSYQLNCADATPVPARGSETFQMELAVPSNPPSNGVLFWNIAGTDATTSAPVTFP